MSVIFELVIPRRPVSSQTRRRTNYHAWIADIRTEVLSALGSSTEPSIEEVVVEIVTFYNETKIDVDNVIKPILDGLSGAVYAEDRLVMCVTSRRAPVGSRTPAVDPALRNADFSLVGECVYVRVTTVAGEEREES